MNKVQEKLVPPVERINITLKIIQILLWSLNKKNEKIPTRFYYIGRLVWEGQTSEKKNNFNEQCLIKINTEVGIMCFEREDERTGE